MPREVIGILSRNAVQLRIDLGQISTSNRRISRGKRTNSASALSAVKTLARPDQWAVDMGLRVDGRPFTMEGGEYIQQLIRDYSPEIVIPKAAQMRFTIAGIIKALHYVTEKKFHGLYLLPLKEGARTFVQSRIDTIIESNDSLERKFSSVDNRLHKKTDDDVNLYIRGTNINRELQEFPVDFEIWDERDRMVDDNLDDARHRMDGSRHQRIVQISTPTVDGHGIWAEDTWEASDQHVWEIPCPHCSRFQVLSFEGNILLGDKAIESVCQCQFCRKEISDDHRQTANAFGRWVPQNLDSPSLRGYHISQLNSPTQRLEAILTDYFKGQRQVKKLKAFYNLGLGIPWAAPGDRFTPEILDKCRVPAHKLGGIPGSWLAVGVDVGTLLHVRADWMNRHGQRHAWAMKTFRTFDELENFLKSLAAFVCVIDMHPEKHKATELSKKFPGRVWCGYEMDRVQSAEVAAWHKAEKGEPQKVTIDRTLAFDQVISRYMLGNVILPGDARDIGELMVTKPYNGFYHQMCQMARVEEEDAHGTIRAFWKKNRNPDHWHHADMFCEIATMRKPRLEIPTGLQGSLNKGFVNG